MRHNARVVFVAMDLFKQANNVTGRVFPPLVTAEPSVAITAHWSPALVQAGAEMGHEMAPKNVMPQTYLFLANQALRIVLLTVDSTLLPALAIAEMA